MPQRNGQNPIRAARDSKKAGGSFTGMQGAQAKQELTMLVCPSCKSEVRPRPGFRISSMKCPACGGPLTKK